jgi:predicted metal-dependent hydrolase
MIPFRATRYASGDRLEVEGCPVRLRVDGRARRVSLRLDPAKREVVATAPSPRKLNDAIAFARERARWMSEVLAELPEGRPLLAGERIEVLGRPCRLEPLASRRGGGLFEEDAGLVLRAHGEDAAGFGRAAVRILKAQALKVLRERTAEHAAALGVAMPEVKLTDARSRWGSCKPPRGMRVGTIRYSWRLVLAPYEVMDYVAAHEVAHLVRADHSPAFWAEVAKLTSYAKRARAWLRAHGQALHAVGR